MGGDRKRGGAVRRSADAGAGENRSGGGEGAGDMKPLPGFATDAEWDPVLARRGLSKEEAKEIALPIIVCLEYLEACPRPQTVDQISRALIMPRALVLDCLDTLMAFQPPLIIERRKKRRRLFLADQQNITALWQAITTTAALKLANALASLSAPFQIHATEAKDGRVL